MKIENTAEAPAAALAYLLGITPRQVQRLAKAGIIPRSARGHYDLSAAIRAWGAYVSHGKATAELGSERRRLVSAQARRAEMEVAKAEGEMLLADDVQIVLNEAMTIIANGMESLGGRLASELANDNDPASIRQKILRETRQIRSDAADKLVRLVAINSDPANGRITQKRGSKRK